jgi:hypothetical protein
LELVARGLGESLQRDIQRPTDDLASAHTPGQPAWIIRIENLLGVGVGFAFVSITFSGGWIASRPFPLRSGMAAISRS